MNTERTNSLVNIYLMVGKQKNPYPRASLAWSAWTTLKRRIRKEIWEYIMDRK